MKAKYDYSLTNGDRGNVEDFTEEAELREFLKAHKRDIDSITVTLDDGRTFYYNQVDGWKEFDLPL